MIVFHHNGTPARLDAAIAAAAPEISRREAKRLIDDARAVVNGAVVGAASREVRAGDRVTVLAGVPDLPLLELDAVRAVIDKPAGLAAQLAQRAGLLSALEVLAAQLKRAGEPNALWVVHRLDTGTSGVLCYARTRVEAARLSAFFAQNAFEKRYVAIVAGIIDRELVLEAPIRGREAATTVRPMATAGATTRVEIEIATGRTHQIRVHLAAAGHPVLGDVRYGGPPAARLMLHAWKLAHPDVGAWEAPIPF